MGGVSVVKTRSCVISRAAKSGSWTYKKLRTSNFFIIFPLFIVYYDSRKLVYKKSIILIKNLTICNLFLFGKLFIEVFSIFVKLKNKNNLKQQRKIMELLFLTWFSISLLFLIVEIMSPGLFLFLSFSFGAMVTAFLTNNFALTLFLQICIFFGLSLITFIVLCVWLQKKQRRSSPGSKTNIFALQGKRAIVVQEIKALQKGQINVNGERWLAKMYDNEYCHVGAVVEIIEVVGCHCIVKLYKE